MINTYANYLRLAEELEREQTSHAETRKLLLKACNERDSLLESIRYICDSARIAAASELKTRKLLEEAHDDLDKMRGEIDAAIRDCYLSLGMGENVAFRKAVADRLTKKATPELVAPAPCGFYEALDKHGRNGVIAAAVDIGRHHQELMRHDESRTDEKLCQMIAAADAEADESKPE